MQYAANDVLYIMQLAGKLKAELEAKGLYQFAVEDSNHLSLEIAAEVPKEKLFSEVGNYRYYASS